MTVGPRRGLPYCSPEASAASHYLCGRYLETTVMTLVLCERVNIRFFTSEVRRGHSLITGDTLGVSEVLTVE